MKKLLSLIPAKTLAKYLPEIMAYILTKGLGWIFKNYPQSATKTIETTKEVTAALTQNINAAADGVIDKAEVQKGIALWKDVFD